MKQATIETLEDRRLLSVAANVNFQPTGATVPAGYLADGGQLYANRGNGFTYGWNIDNASTTRDKNSSRSLDQRYDTLIHLQKLATPAVWEIALPNDTYKVHLVSGDAANFDSVFKIDVEGTLAINATPTTTNRWAEGTVTVVVTDGKLTVKAAAGAANAKLNFVDIESTDTQPPPPPPPPPTTGFVARVNFQPASAAVPAGYVADSGLVFGARGNGFSYGWSTNNSAYARDRNLSRSPDQRYDTLNHLQKTAAPAVWEIVVPNGTYTVHAVSGDANAFDSVFRIDVEGVLAINATPTSADRWAEGALQVTVTDGRLTIKAASGAVNAKLNFVDIRSATGGSSLLEQINHTLDYAKSRTLATLNEIGNNTSTYLHYTNSSGNWVTTNASGWTSGFLPGQMWQLYQNTGDTAWRDRATNWTLGLSGQTSQDGDLAFRFMTTYKPLYDLTGNAAYRQVLLNAAAEKNSHWNEAVGAFETTWFSTRSGNPQANFAVLTDMTTDLELMFWAAVQTGNTQYYERAVRHMENVVAHNMRADGSTAQFSMFDSDTGNFVMNETWQGYANNSTWSRGQAWAVLSFIDVAKTTGRADFLAAAQKVADWFIDHLPADFVPYWDFNAPNIPNAVRDSSAAAVAASGLVDLAQYLDKTGAGAKYYAAAEKILGSLMGPAYFAEGSVHDGLLLHGASSVPSNIAVNNSLVYGDYYLLQAITRYKSL